MGVSGPSLLIESTDSMINICTKAALILSVCISVHAYESGRFIHQISFSNNITELIINLIAIYHHS